MGISNPDASSARRKIWGRYEDYLFATFSKSYLRARGGRWANPPTKDMDKPTKKERGEFARIVRKRSKVSSLWGWKNPRTVLYIESFVDLLPQPLFIHSVRDRMAIIQSIKRKYKRFPLCECERICDFYTAKIERFGKRHALFEVHYDKLIEDTENEVARIASKIGLSPTKDAARFVKPEFRHY